MFAARAQDYLRAVTRRRALAGLAATALPLPSRAATGGILRIGRAEEPDTLDPHKTSLAVSESTMRLIFEPLVRRDADGRVAPALAEGWELRDDGRTIVFHLRRGVAFHDGSPVDAAACVATTQRQLDPATASPNAFLLGPFERAEAIDPGTVAYTWKQPFVPVWVGLTTSYCAILPPGAGAQFGRRPVGAGPFRFASWSPDGGIRLLRNAAYACGRPPPALDEVVLQQIPEDSTRLAALDSDEIQGMFLGQSVPLDRVRRLAGDDDVALLTRPAQAMRAIAFNQSLAPTSDKLVRQAISHAIDPARVVALAMDGQAKVARGPLASTIAGYDARVEQLGYGYDPGRARQMLGGASLQLRMICNDTSTVRRSAEVVQAQLREVGVAMTIDSMPIGQWAVASKKGEHHLVFQTYSYTDPDILAPEFLVAGSLNRGFAKDEALDRVILASRVEFDPAKRQALLDQVQETVVRDAYWAPLFEPYNFAAFSRRVQGAVLRADGDVDLALVSLAA